MRDPGLLPRCDLADQKLTESRRHPPIDQAYRAVQELPV